MSTTTVDVLMPVLEKIARLESSKEPKHRVQMEKLVAELPEGVPLMWSYRRVAEYTVKKARLEKALENNRAAVKEAMAAEEARIAEEAWKWSAGRTPPNPADAPDVKRGRELIASMEKQFKELTAANRLLVAMVEGIAEDERDIKAIRDWRLYGGAIPSCVERDTEEKHAEMGLVTLTPGIRAPVSVDPDAWIDDWNLPVPEWNEASDWKMPTVEDMERAMMPAPVVEDAPVVVAAQKPVVDRRRVEGEARGAYARRVLFKC